MFARIGGGPVLGGLRRGVVRGCEWGADWCWPGLGNRRAAVVRWTGAGSQQPDFAEFYREVKDECLFAVLVIAGDRDTAQDLVAEAFARAWASWPSVSSSVAACLPAGSSSPAAAITQPATSRTLPPPGTDQPRARSRPRGRQQSP